MNARGPNFQLNAACSSTSTAISLAEDMIRGGRARHMLVIGADDPTSRDALPYLGAGFLSTGACTNAADLYEAALPFDRRRNGMIMGAGAVALVIESERECMRRGTNPVCELLGSHVFNTAGHASQLDVPRYAEELDQFVTRMEAQHSIERDHVAGSLVYLSHETFTPPRGGCSESEAVALRHVFGARVSEIEVSNTKGMTGHTMGAALEDAVAAKALESGRTAPVVNFKEADPVLAGLKLSDGTPRQFDYALRMAAGFGSQGNYILLRRWATSGGRRVASEEVYQQWLRSISGIERPELAEQGRVLVVKDTKPGAVCVNRPNIDTLHSKRERGSAASGIQPARTTALLPESSATDCRVPQSNAPSKPTSVDPQEGLAPRSLVLEVVSEVTGYAASILELDMELEADLGIDTVKQATVLARLAERMRLASMSTLRLSDYPTLRSIVEWCALAPAQAKALSRDEGGVSRSVDARDSLSSARLDSPSAPETTRRQVLTVIAEVTGYSVDILDVSMELEADLGIDTVKQATILALLSERAGTTEIAALKMSDFSTVGQLVSAFATPITTATTQVSSTHTAPITTATAQTSSITVVVPPRGTNNGNVSSSDQRNPEAGGVRQTVYETLGSLTAYPSDMLEDDLSLHGDLGLSATVIEQVRDALARAHGLGADFTVLPDTRLCDLVQRIELAVRHSPSGGLIDSSSQLSTALGRQVLALRPAPSVQAAKLELEGKLIWVIGDEPRSVSTLQRQFETHRAKVRTLVVAATGTLEELDAAMDALIENGSPSLVVDLTALPDTLPVLERDLEQAMSAVAKAADFRFAVYKRLLGARGPIQRILAVTGLDGSFALTPNSTAPINAIYGLHIGFYKALRKAWRECQVSILDVAPSLWANGAGCALELIERELGVRGPGVEVCYLDGHRHRVVVEDSTWDDVHDGEPLGHNEVVVATGGGSGITARILIELAGRSPAQFALIGRTELETTALGLDFTDPKSVDTERAAIQHALEAAGIRATPRAIAERLEQRQRSAEIYSTLAALERLGSKARYYRADATDPAAMQAVLNQIRETMGAITTLICGAGLEVSHTFEQKTLEEFQRVHRVKSVGAYLLAQYCRNDPLRRFVTLSSISGRFGNAAQIDYSAANAFLDVMMRTHRRPGVRALSLLWSGWSDLGMAWRNNYVRMNAEKEGLSLIPPQAGARVAALEILAAQGPSEVLVHRGLGGIIDGELSTYEPDQYPLIDWVEKRAGRVTRIHRRVSHQRDALLDQHRFAGVPYMPGVGFMEMMAESARLTSIRGGRSVVFRDLAFLEGFKLHREEPRDVWLELEPGSAPGETVMTVKAPAVSAVAIRSAPREYAKARVVLTDSPPPVALDPAWNLESTASTDYATLLAAARARKQNVQFGPLFNDACSAENRVASPVRWSAQGLESHQRLPQAQLTHAQYPLDRFQL
ncbi:MAG TPA: SDR family NAD(P)-dependent oxidoreductase, partial [Polyangiaceae bacterium]|nr:SDR family NAD(P)-dependent oxidoreductase [Polyangiaceae bacterium]